MGVAEPREPTTKLAAFAGGETVRNLELQLHGFAETGEARVARIEVVDEFGGGLEFMARGMQAGALEDGDGLGFGAGVGFTDDGPFLDGGTDVPGLGFRRGVVHGQQDDGDAFGRGDVMGGAGLDEPRAFEAKVFGTSERAEQERDGEEGFSEVVHASGEGLRPR